MLYLGPPTRAEADLTGVFMSWLYVFLSIALDVSGTLCLKLSNGLSRGVPTALMFLCYTLSLAPLALAARHLPVGVVYAVWSALGTVLVASIGMLWFKEPASAVKVFSLVLIVTGLFLLNLKTSS